MALTLAMSSGDICSDSQKTEWKEGYINNGNNIFHSQRKSQGLFMPKTL